MHATPGRLARLAALLVSLAPAARAETAPEPAVPEAPPPAPLAAPPPPAPALPLGLAFGFGPQGLAFGTPETFQLRLNGLVQTDGRSYLGEAAPAPDTFVLRRLRPILAGTVADLADFRLLPDFGEGKAQVLDAFVDLRPWPWLRLRAGKFKSPVGLERLAFDQSMPFLERGLPTNLVGDRDIGASLHGDVAGGTLSYELAVLDGAPDNQSVDGDVDGEKDVAARLFVSPLRPLGVEALRSLGLGVSASTGRQRGSPTATLLNGFKSPGQVTFFSYLADAKSADGTVYAWGQHTRVVPQASYFGGPVGAWAEYAWESQALRKGAKAGVARNRAWQAGATFVVTLERASPDGVNPSRPFSLANRTFGAVEVGARYGELRADPDAFPTFADPDKSARTARSGGAVLSWYLTRNVRFSGQLERTAFEGGAKGGDRPAETSLIGRLQVAF